MGWEIILNFVKISFYQFSIKGKNDDGKLNTEFPKKVNVPIVSDGQCLRTHEAFVHITSDRTFCAGGRMGEGPCQGDSGEFKIILAENLSK